MNETAMQTALRTWVRLASKLDDSKIVWSEQDIPRLATPYITMRMGDLVPLGSTDEVNHTYDATQPNGQEIEIEIKGQRSFALSLQCFGDGPNQSARQILSNVQTALGLPSVMGILEAAGLSSYDKTPIQNVTALLETAFEPRAVTSIYFYCSEAVSERTTYIESVEVENEINETTFTIPEE